MCASACFFLICLLTEPIVSMRFAGSLVSWRSSTRSVAAAAAVAWRDVECISSLSWQRAHKLDRMLPRNHGRRKPVSDEVRATVESLLNREQSRRWKERSSRWDVPSLSDGSWMYSKVKFCSWARSSSAWHDCDKSGGASSASNCLMLGKSLFFISWNELLS